MDVPFTPYPGLGLGLGLGLRVNGSEVRCEVDVVCVLGFNYLSAAGCAHCDIASTKVERLARAGRAGAGGHEKKNATPLSIIIFIVLSGLDARGAVEKQTAHAAARDRLWFGLWCKQDRVNIIYSKTYIYMYIHR